MSTQSEKCRNDRDSFCFVCGLRIFEEKVRSIDNLKFIEAYEVLFKFKPESSDWCPNRVCANCYINVTSSTSACSSSPMEWNKPKNHPFDCYFCQTIVPKGTNKRKSAAIVYADVPSVKKAKLSSEATESMEVGTSRNVEDIDVDDTAGEDIVGEASGYRPEDQAAAVVVDAVMGTGDALPTYSPSGQFFSPSYHSPSYGPQDTRSEGSSVASPASSGSYYQPARHYYEFRPTKETILLNQAAMNDIVRDLDLPKDRAELLASRLTDLGLGERMYTILILDK